MAIDWVNDRDTLTEKKRSWHMWWLRELDTETFTKAPRDIADRIEALEAEVKRLRDERDELNALLEDVTAQATMIDGVLDSAGLSAYEDGIEHLCKIGRAVSLVGGRIRARLVAREAAEGGR